MCCEVSRCWTWVFTMCPCLLAGIHELPLGSVCAWRSIEGEVEDQADKDVSDVTCKMHVATHAAPQPTLVWQLPTYEAATEKFYGLSDLERESMAWHRWKQV